MSVENSIQLNILIKKRGSIKSSLTHLKKFVDSLKSKEVLDDITIIEIQPRITRFNELLANFNEIQNLIELLLENLEEQYEERERFVNGLDRYVAIARNLIRTSKF